MYPIITFLLGLVVGAICMLLYALERLRRVRATQQAAEGQEKRAKAATDAANAKQNELRQQEAQMAQRADEMRARMQAREQELETRVRAFDRRVISYREIEDENDILKRDLQNIDVNLHKVQLDAELQAQRQEQLDERSKELGKRYLGDTVKAVVASVGPNNFAGCKQRLLKVIGWCREIGFDVSAQEEARLLTDLRNEFEREKTAIQAALDQALAEARDKHSEEVQRLQSRLAEAEAKSQRAISLAQQTKAGNVYVISNIGSFGEGVFKVGMTRRLEPMDRVRELGDASVPFPFDVHMMVSCSDAPAMERNTADHLNVIGAHPQNSPGGFATDGERFV